MTDRLERVLSTILVGASVAIATGLVHREFFASTQPVSAAAQPHRLEKRWKGLLASGDVLGDTTAPVKIIEFADFQCPFCRALHKNLRDVVAQDPKGIAVYFFHFPIEGHPFALPAARAAECARSQGKFSEFAAAIFAKQDSLGIKSWGSFGVDAGLKDTTEVARCAMDSREVAHIEANRALGGQLEVTGTPTMYINGWRVEGVVSKSEILRIASALTRGKDPFALETKSER